MGLDGIGTCVLPPAVLQQELLDGRMVILDAGIRLPPLDFYVNASRDADVWLTQQITDTTIKVARASLERLAADQRI
jgi:hypothetical protein